MVQKPEEVVRQLLSVLLISILTLASGLQIISVNSFSSMVQYPGCFGVNTKIPGVEGAFAAVATDDAGGVFVAYHSRMENDSNYYIHVYFAYSHDYGVSWSESFRVNDNESSSVQCDSPGIAVDPHTGHIFVAWKDNRTGVAKAYVDKSVDRGVSFGSDVVVYDWPNDYMFMGLPLTVNIKVGDDGKVYVAWMMYDGSSLTDCDILFASSIDGGQTFSTPTNVNPLEGEARHSHPWIAIDEGNVIYVAYPMRNSTFSGVYVARSLNGGSSFETPVKVNDDSTARYRGGAQVIVSEDGNIHVVWTDGRAGDGTQYLDIYYANSRDSGLSFSPNVCVNDDYVVTPPDTHPAFTRGAQGTPSIATDSDSRVHIVWEDFRNFVSETTYCRDIYYASSEGGTSFTKNLRASSVNASVTSVNCADPNIVVDSQNNLFTVYSDAPSGDQAHHDIYFMFTPSSAWRWTTFLDWVHYHNYTEIATILLGLNDTYPDIVDVFSIGQSWQNRDIYCIRLTNESDGTTKPEVLFIGYHHAQEQISAELPLYYLVDAATNYRSDVNVTNLLNTREIYVIVALNVDGLDLFDASDRQRKNARSLDDDSDGSLDEDPPEDLNGNDLIEVLVNYTDPYDPEIIGYEGVDNDTDGMSGEDWIGGVDLNRNYPVGWENAVSDPSSPVYRGSASFSEPETQAIRDLVLQHNFTHAISFHSGLEFIIYPWGCTADPTPDDAKFMEIAQGLSNITGGTFYDSPTVMYGIWDDWMYDEAGVLALTCEIFRNGTWMDAVIESGPYPSTSWVGGERWLYNPFPSGIETVIQRWLPVFTYIVDLARPPNLAVSAITTSKTIVGEGFILNVTVVVANHGSMIEEINVTVYLDDDAFESLSASVKGGESAVCSFAWNTTGFSKGNYTVSAVVDAAPGETDIADNTFVGSTVTVAIPGDIDGDRDVDIFDIVRIAGVYGTSEPNPSYDPDSDIDGDGDIDIFDIVVAASHYGESW
ncbi:MAG: M14 family zinc carboxypeptidase [Candidatus Bathyarchaeota archaeon]|nr:M14 family zinc carboxypeptidase [Candidatus Bathyarchaeota archaeon]